MDAAGLCSFIRFIDALSTQGDTHPSPLGGEARSAANRFGAALVRRYTTVHLSGAGMGAADRRSLIDAVRATADYVVAGDGKHPGPATDDVAAGAAFLDALLGRIRRHEGGEDIAFVLEMLPEVQAARKAGQRATPAVPPPAPPADPEPELSDPIMIPQPEPYPVALVEAKPLDLAGEVPAALRSRNLPAEDEAQARAKRVERETADGLGPISRTLRDLHHTIERTARGGAALAG